MLDKRTKAQALEPDVALPVAQLSPVLKIYNFLVDNKEGIQQKVDAFLIISVIHLVLHLLTAEHLLVVAPILVRYRQLLIIVLGDGCKALVHFLLIILEFRSEE